MFQFLAADFFWLDASGPAAKIILVACMSLQLVACAGKNVCRDAEYDSNVFLAFGQGSVLALSVLLRKLASEVKVHVSTKGNHLHILKQLSLEKIVSHVDRQKG